MAATHLGIVRHALGSANANTAGPAGSGMPLDYMPSIAFLNADGTTDTANTGLVTITANVGTLSGTVSMNAVAGIADFATNIGSGNDYADANIAITGVGTTTLTYSASGVTSVSDDPITVIAPTFDPFSLAQSSPFVSTKVELPRSEPSTTYPTISAQYTVKASGGDFTTVQAAIDALVASDTALHREIVCDNNTTITGQVRLRDRANGMGKIIIRSATLPTANKRVIRGSADHLAMPTFTSEEPNGQLVCDDHAHDYWIVGLAFNVPVPAAGDATEIFVVVDWTATTVRSGTGTISCSSGVATFSTSQASVPYFGARSTVTVGGTDYLVTSFNGTTGAVLQGSPTFGASSFTITNNTKRTTMPFGMGMDRCVITGQPTTRLRKGVNLQCGDAFITNSWIDDVHDFYNVGSGPIIDGVQQTTGSVINGVSHYGNGNGDTNAVDASFATGPHLYQNCYMSGAGEVSLYGGTDTPLDYPVPADITCRWNVYQKPLAWQNVYPAKNIWELKNAQRVLLEGCILDGSWLANQDGTGFLMAPNNQSGTAPWTSMRHITARNNFFRNLTAWMSLTRDNSFVGLPIARPTQFLSIYNNVTTNINGMEPVTGDGVNRCVFMAGLISAVVRHNTLMSHEQANTKALVLDIVGQTGTVYDDNISACYIYGVTGNSTAPGTSSITTYLPGDPFKGNVLIGLGTDGIESPSDFPSTSFYPTTNDAVGFVDDSIVSSWVTADPDAICAALTLASGSPYKAQASDGTDPGANMTTVRSSILGVLAGTPGSSITATEIRITSEPASTYTVGDTITVVGAATDSSGDVDTTLASGIVNLRARSAPDGVDLSTVLDSDTWASGVAALSFQVQVAGEWTFGLDDDSHTLTDSATSTSVTVAPSGAPVEAMAQVPIPLHYLPSVTAPTIDANALIPVQPNVGGIPGNWQSTTIPQITAAAGIFSLTDPRFAGGAKGVGTDDTAAILAALSAASAVRGVVWAPPGLYGYSSQIVIPRGVKLIGAGIGTTALTGNGTQFTALATFPTNTPHFVLGDSTELCFDTRIQDCRIVCNAIAGSIGVDAPTINENSGLVRVLVQNYLSTGLRMYDQNASTLFASNYRIEDCQFWCDPTASNSIGIDIQTGQLDGVIQKVSVVASSGQLAGVRVAGLSSAGGGPMIYDLHVEGHTEGILDAGNGSVSAANVSTSVAGTNTVHLSSTVRQCSLRGIFRQVGVGTATVQDDRAGVTLTTEYVACYEPASTRDGWQALTTPGSGSTESGNIMGASNPTHTVKSTAPSGSAARANYRLRDGNGNGWDVQYVPDAGTTLPLQIRPAAANVLASSIFTLTATGGIRALATANGPVGTFTMAASATKNVSNTNVTSSSIVLLFPTNAAAATLQSGSKSLYIASLTSGGSFNVATADGTAAAGTETFNYLVLN